MACKTVNVDVDIGLDDFDDDDLLNEVEKRGLNKKLIRIADFLHLGKEKEALNLLRDYIYEKVGKVVV